MSCHCRDIKIVPAFSHYGINYNQQKLILNLQYVSHKNSEDLRDLVLFVKFTKP